MFWCGWLVGVRVGGCVLVGVCCVVSDAHVSVLFPCFCFLFVLACCLVNNGGVGFGVGLRVFMLGGVNVPVSVFSLVSLSGRSASGGSASGSSSGVVVCVPCAVRVFGVSWCSLVLRRWARAVGVDVARVVVLLGSAPVSGSVSAPGVGVSSAPVLGSVPVLVSGSSSSSPSSVSAGGFVSVCSASVGGGRVGAGFGCPVFVIGVGGRVVVGGVVGFVFLACARVG